MNAALRWGPLLRLSWRDLWHERWLALCTACVLAATLAPLWTLWGLERGVIGTLIERQDRDPLMRRIEPVGSGASRFDAAWLDRARAWPEVAFVVPTVRASSALVRVGSDNGADLFPLRETGANDPLLGGIAPPAGEAVVMSAEAARKLKVAAGATVRIALERRREGRDENAAVSVKVAALLPLSVSDSSEALAPPALLERIERWREGFTVEGLGSDGNGPPPARTVYPLFRMHATSIREVSALVQRLESEGISTRTAEREIEATLGLQRNLRTVLGLVGAVTVGGAVVALAALQIATLRRKRREFALLKLTGHGRGWLVAMPCVQAALVAVLGSALAFLVYQAGAAAINAHFASHLATSEAAVRLHGIDVVVGTLAALGVSVLPALFGGWRASNVEAADELREH